MTWWLWMGLGGFVGGFVTHAVSDLRDRPNHRDTSGHDWATFHGYECTCSAWFGRHAASCPHHPSFRRDRVSE